jgi:hypothetical protein
MGGAPNWFLSLLRVPLCNQDSPAPDRHCAPGEATPFVGSTGPLVPGRDGSPSLQGMLSPGNKEVKDTICKSWTESPEML